MVQNWRYGDYEAHRIRALVFLELDGCSLRAQLPASDRVQKFGCGLSLQDPISDGVGVLFVAVTCLAYASAQVHPLPLLDDMGRLMCGGVQVRGRTEGYMCARRVCLGSDGLGSLRGAPTDVGLDAADVVMPES